MKLQLKIDNCKLAITRPQRHGQGALGCCVAALLGRRSQSPQPGTPRREGEAQSRPLRRLAYVCHIFPHLTQTFVYREVEELRRSGVALTVFSMKPPEEAALSTECRHLITDTVYLPPVTSVSILASQLFWLLRSPRRYLRALALVARGRYRFNNTPALWLHGMVDFARGVHLARRISDFGFRISDFGSGGSTNPQSAIPNPKFVHLHAQFADDACTTTLVASLLSGIRYSFRSHTSPNSQLIDAKVRQAQFVVSASRYDRRVLVHWCGEQEEERIYVNHLGVPLCCFAPGDELRVTSDEGRPDPTRHSSLVTRHWEPPLILSVGTLCAKKGFEYVIRACRMLADQEVAFHCLIVGDGPDRAKLASLVERLHLGDQVSLAPYQPQEALRDLYRQAAVFTLPCIFPLDGNVDVIPLVLQEAMAMARPVVSTPISGIPELIQDGVNGLLVPEKDHEALAEALARLLADPELGRRLGAAARETIVRHFDVAANAAELAGILRREVPELTADGRRETGDGSPAGGSSNQGGGAALPPPLPDYRLPSPVSRPGAKRHGR